MIYSIFVSYVIFCIATGLTSYFTLFRPLMEEIERRDLELKGSKIVSAFTTTILMAFKAPLVIFTVLKGADEDFFNSVIEEISNDE